MLLRVTIAGQGFDVPPHLSDFYRVHLGGIPKLSTLSGLAARQAIDIAFTTMLAERMDYETEREWANVYGQQSMTDAILFLITIRLWCDAYPGSTVHVREVNNASPPSFQHSVSDGAHASPLGSVGPISVAVAPPYLDI